MIIVHCKEVNSFHCLDKKVFQFDVGFKILLVKVISNSISYTIQSFIVNFSCSKKQYLRQTVVQHFLLDIPQL